MFVILYCKKKGYELIRAELLGILVRTCMTVFLKRYQKHFSYLIKLDTKQHKENKTITSNICMTDFDSQTQTLNIGNF